MVLSYYCVLSMSDLNSSVQILYCTNSKSVSNTVVWATSYPGPFLSLTGKTLGTRLWYYGLALNR